MRTHCPFQGNTSEYKQWDIINIQWQFLRAFCKLDYLTGNGSETERTYIVLLSNERRSFCHLCVSSFTFSTLSHNHAVIYLGIISAMSTAEIVYKIVTTM